MGREAKTAVVGTEACRRWWCLPCLMPSTLLPFEATRNDFYLLSLPHHVSDCSSVPSLFFLFLHLTRCSVHTPWLPPLHTHCHNHRFTVQPLRYNCQFPSVLFVPTSTLTSGDSQKTCLGPSGTHLRHPYCFWTWLDCNRSA
jgi:hypothetical protein